MSVILGIDPGTTGAMVWLHVQSNTIEKCIDNSLWCEGPYADRDLYEYLSHLEPPDIIVVEAQHARATRDAHGKVVQGIASTWTYAEHYGIIKGCVRQYKKPVYFPDPGVWKGSMNLGNKTEKRLSLEKARELWPGSVHLFKRKMDHGRAEAALVAYYGKRFLPPEKRRVL